MTAGWRECADPVELAAAVAAGAEVQRNWGYDWHPWWLFAACAVVLVGVLLAAVLTRGPEREDER